MKTELKADIMLLFVTLCWGASYLMMDICMEEMEVLNLNAFRFLVAFLIAGAISFKKLLGVSKETLKYSLVVSVCQVLVYCGATYGVKYTSISYAGFLIGLSSVMTPVLAIILYRTLPEKKLVAAVILCVLGTALLTLGGGGNSDSTAFGNILCILTALFYSIALLITERAVQKPNVDPYLLGVTELAFIGIIMMALSAAFEQPHMPQSPRVLWAALFLAVLCTGLAFVVQNVAQQYTSATKVGLIFSLEPVFAGIVAYFAAGEILTGQAYFGAFLMILGIFVMEIDFRRK